MIRMRTRINQRKVAIATSGGCLSIIVAILINMVIGGLSVDFLLKLFGKNIHWFADSILGLIAGTVTIPTAIVIWILQSLGVM